MSASGLSQREFARQSNCDEKQVRRAIAKGLLKANSDGTLDPAQLTIGWRRPIRSSKDVADKSKNVRADKKVSAPVVDDDDTPAQAAAKLVVAMGAKHDLAEAIRIKENYNAMLKQLEYERESGALVSLDLAQKVFFNEFRAQRDAWLNWPMRIAPLLAAELGIEADKVTEAITAHVHKHITDLGESEPRFEEKG